VLAGTRAVIDLAGDVGRVELEAAGRERLLQSILHASRSRAVPDGSVGSAERER